MLEKHWKCQYNLRDAKYQIVNALRLKGSKQLRLLELSAS